MSYRGAVRKLLRLLRQCATDERAQDTLETIITIAVVVVFVTALLAGLQALTPQFLGNACGSIDTGFPPPTPPSAYSICLTPTPAP